jgi:hypothetical protein
MKRAAIVLLLLGACAPQEKSADAPEAPAAALHASELAADELPAPDGEISVSGLTPGQRVSSPLVIEGFVQNNWMFEGVFPIEIVADGETLAQHAGQQQEPDNWTNPGPVKFRTEMVFDVIKETPAVVIFREDMPQPISPDSDEAGPARTLRIPVVLLPPAQ